MNIGGVLVLLLFLFLSTHRMQEESGQHACHADQYSAGSCD